MINNLSLHSVKLLNITVFKQEAEANIPGWSMVTWYYFTYGKIHYEPESYINGHLFSLSQGFKSKNYLKFKCKLAGTCMIMFYKHYNNYNYNIHD